MSQPLKNIQDQVAFNRLKFFSPIKNAQNQLRQISKESALINVFKLDQPITVDKRNQRSQSELRATTCTQPLRGNHVRATQQHTIDQQSGANVLANNSAS